VVAVEVVAADVVVVYEVVSCVRVEVDDLMMVGSKATGDKEVAGNVATVVVEVVQAEWQSD